MANVAELLIRILADNKGAKKALSETSGAAAKVESAFGSMALPAGAALGAIALGAAKTSKAASDLEQSSGAVESVFKGNSDAVKAFAKDSAKSTGLAASEYQQMAAVLGAQLKGMGVPTGELAKKTDDLIRKGADLSATFGGDTSEAVSALSALLRGERDPIERYGVSIKEADVAAQLAADGVTKATKATGAYAKSTKAYDSAAKAVEKTHSAVEAAQLRLTTAQKDGTPAQVASAKAALKTAKANDAAAVAHLAEADAAKAASGKVPVLTADQEKAATSAATLALLTSKTADAAGGFARETDTAAHAQQVANAQIEDASAALGTALLPIIVAVTGMFGELAVFVRDNATAFQALVVVIGLVAAAVLAINVAFKIYRAVTMAAQAAQWLLNAAMSANPLGIIVIAILAVVAALVLLWQNSETFRNIVTAVFNTVLGVVQGVVAWITDAFGKLGAILKAPWDVFLAAVRSVVATVKGIVKGLADFISGIFDGIKKAASTIGDAIDAVNPFGAPPPAGRTARSVAGPWASRAAARGGGSSGGITVNVQTTGDTIEAEAAVVRAIRRAQRLNAGRVVPAFGVGSMSARRELTPPPLGGTQPA